MRTNPEFFLIHYKTYSENDRREFIYSRGKGENDQEFLKKFYPKETAPYIRETMVAMIMDESFKKQVAVNDSNEKVRKMALVTLKRSGRNARFIYERLMLDHSPLVKDFARAVLKETAPALRFIIED